CGNVSDGFCATKWHRRSKTRPTSTMRSAIFASYWLRPTALRLEQMNAELKSVASLLKEALATEGEASAEIFEGALTEANVPDTQWRLGNYEVLEEIGRGGMGVIYRARQRHSRRIVALKRVLTYQAESHETLKRFQREAEAA